MTGLILIKCLLAFILSVLGIALLVFAYKLAIGNESEYINNKLRNKKWYSPFVSGLISFREGYRDDRVKTGLAVNTKKNQWVELGILSEKAIDSVVRK